jgi:hypothetical protein
MTGELALRFVLGGVIVSLFAATGEMFQPKTFAGLFGAAPAVAIATLGMAYASKGSAYVAIESRSMLLGCAALLVYGAACVAMADRRGVPVWLGAVLAWVVWGAVAFAGLAVLRLTGIEG